MFPIRIALHEIASLQRPRLDLRHHLDSLIHLPGIFLHLGRSLPVHHPDLIEKVLKLGRRKFRASWFKRRFKALDRAQHIPAPAQSVCKSSFGVCHGSKGYLKVNISKIESEIDRLSTVVIEVFHNFSKYQLQSEVLCGNLRSSVLKNSGTTLLSMTWFCDLLHRTKMTAVTYPHIEVKGGVARVGKTRYKVLHLAGEHYYYGWTAEELLRQHPDLQPEEIYAALGFFYDNYDELVEQLKASTEEVSQHRAKTCQPSRAELLERRKAKPAR